MALFTWNIQHHNYVNIWCMYKHTDPTRWTASSLKLFFVSEVWRFNTFGMMNSSKILIFQDQAEDLFVLAYSLLDKNICSLRNVFLVFSGRSHASAKISLKKWCQWIPTNLNRPQFRRNETPWTSWPDTESWGFFAELDLLSTGKKLLPFGGERWEKSSNHVGSLGGFCFDVRIEVWQPNSAAKYIYDICICIIWCVYIIFFKYMHNTTLYQV